MKTTDCSGLPLSGKQIRIHAHAAGSPLPTCPLTPDICAILYIADYCPERVGSLIWYKDGHCSACILTPKRIIMDAIHRTHILTLILPRLLLLEKHRPHSRLPLPTVFGRKIFLPLSGTRNGTPSFVALHHLARTHQHTSTCDFYFGRDCHALSLPYYHRDINEHIDVALAIGQEIWTFIQCMASQSGLIHPRIPLSPVMKQWVARNPDAKPNQARLLELRDYPLLALQESLADSAFWGPDKNQEDLADMKRLLRRLHGY